MPLGLLLCPTRELALQLSAQAAQLVAGSHLTVKCVTGGVPLTQQVLELRKGCDLLVATPGRLMDLLGNKTVNLMRLKVMVREGGGTRGAGVVRGAGGGGGRGGGGGGGEWFGWGDPLGVSRRLG